MKWFIAIVLIAAAGGGWYYWKGKGAAPAADAGIPGPGGAAAGTVPGPTSGGAAAVAGGGDAAPAGDGVPAAVKADWDQAEALWKEAAAAGDPAASANAPRLARLYSAILRASYNQPGAKAFEARLVAERLTPLGTALFFSKARYDDELFAVHKVVAGDVPDKIAKQYGMSYQHLNRLRAREVNDSALRLGDALKVVNQKALGGAQLHVDKGDYYVDAYIGGVFARRYDVSIGAPTTPTPVGTTTVTDLVYNPTWTPPGSSEPIPHGDPRNILGGVWIPVASDGINQSGIGFHGYTGEDQSLRKQASNGCVRLGNEAIKELSYLIAHPNRSPTAVTIVE